ncbi:unnamed protein product, partial [Allacma fusca]
RQVKMIVCTRKLLFTVGVLFLPLFCLEITCAPCVTCDPTSVKNTLLNLLREHENCVSRDPQQIKFYLYNNFGNKDSRREILLNDDSSLETSGYLTGQPLKLLIHGYAETNFDSTFFPENVKDAYLKNQLHSGSGNTNVLVVDSGTLTKPSYKTQLNDRTYFTCYLQAVLNTNVIGERVADMVEFLIKQRKTTPELIHIIGDNLGVHIGGYVGNETTRRFNSKISRLTAIDTALPGFRPNKISTARPMTTDDAKFVDAVNTINQLAFGDADSIGHADFFVNLFLQPDVEGSNHGDSKVGVFQEAMPLGGPIIDSFASFYFAKTVGRSDIMGTSMNSGGHSIFGENCKPGTRGVYFVCFSMVENRPCLFDDAIGASEEMPGKALVKGLGSSLVTQYSQTKQTSCAD